MTRQRTAEEKAARSAHARITVWRAVHEAHKTRKHVVVDWWDRMYHGHITEIDRQGFRVHNHEGDGAWCSWEGATRVAEPWWDLKAAVERPYPQPCPQCVAFFSRAERSAA